jgi:hypothetical protein
VLAAVEEHAVVDVDQVVIRIRLSFYEAAQGKRRCLNILRDTDLPVIQSEAVKLFAASANP